MVTSSMGSVTGFTTSEPELRLSGIAAVENVINRSEPQHKRRLSPMADRQGLWSSRAELGHPC